MQAALSNRNSHTHLTMIMHTTVMHVYSLQSTKYTCIMFFNKAKNKINVTLQSIKTCYCNMWLKFCYIFHSYNPWADTPSFQGKNQTPTSMPHLWAWLILSPWSSPSLISLVLIVPSLHPTYHPFSLKPYYNRFPKAIMCVSQLIYFIVCMNVLPHIILTSPWGRQSGIETSFSH